MSKGNPYHDKRGRFSSKSGGSGSSGGGARRPYPGSSGKHGDPLLGAGERGQSLSQASKPKSGGRITENEVTAQAQRTLSANQVNRKANSPKSKPAFKINKDTILRGAVAAAKSGRKRK